MKIVMTDEQLETAINKAYNEGYKRGYQDGVLHLRDEWDRLSLQDSGAKMDLDEVYNGNTD